MRSIMFLLLIAAITSSTACNGTSSRTSGEDPAGQQTRSILDAHAFQAAIEKGDAVLVDVRMSNEFASGHIPGSINLDWTARDHEVLFAQLDPARPVLLYCASGGRSEQAREYLQAKGYTVQHLDDGIGAWKEAGLPVVR